MVTVLLQRFPMYSDKKDTLYRGIRVISDFLREHWVMVYGFFMFGLGCAYGSWKAKRKEP